MYNMIRRKQSETIKKLSYESFFMENGGMGVIFSCAGDIGHFLIPVSNSLFYRYVITFYQFFMDVHLRLSKLKKKKKLK